MPTVAPTPTIYSITDGITAGATNVGNVLESIWSFMTDNPLIMLFIGVAVVSIGITFFARLKSA